MSTKNQMTKAAAVQRAKLQISMGGDYEYGLTER
jgi:hypothetical protein